MRRGLELHIESLSLDNYITHINQEFIAYAQSGVYRLGWMGGCYVILDRNSGVVYSNMKPNPVLEKYKELLIENAS